MSALLNLTGGEQQMRGPAAADLDEGRFGLRIETHALAQPVAAFHTTEVGRWNGDAILATSIQPSSDSVN
jgi:hypothetical protein